MDQYFAYIIIGFDFWKRNTFQIKMFRGWIQAPPRILRSGLALENLFIDIIQKLMNKYFYSEIWWIYPLVLLVHQRQTLTKLEQNFPHGSNLFQTVQNLHEFVLNSNFSMFITRIVLCEDVSNEFLKFPLLCYLYQHYLIHHFNQNKNKK